jgi:glycosyltransferase involved in cell wall biosynthesis
MLEHRAPTSEALVRALVCVPWRERLGGAEAMLWSVLKHADPRRLELEVAFLEPGPFEREVSELGVRTFAVPAGRLREPRAAGVAIRRLSRIIRARQPDLVLNWVAKAQLYGASAAMVAGRQERVLWWQHGLPNGHWMDRAATALPARAIGCSSRASEAAQAVTRPRRPTFVVHPGVETEKVLPIERSALDIPEERPLVGIAGRLQPWKGQHRFLYGLRHLHDTGHRAHGLLVGGSAHGFSPGYERELSELIPRLGLAGWVTLAGHVPDARPYIAAMDVLVSASANEPFGMVLAEGLIQGVPVVAVSDAGPREIVDHGVTGLLVRRPDAALLAAAVGELLDDERRRERMASAARQAAVARFGVRAMTRAVETKLGALAREGAWPDDGD